jgi:thioredoxin reductase/ferredoxin
MSQAPSLPIDYKRPETPTQPKRRNPVARYMHWLHTMWPAGTVERLPVVREDGSTNVPGLYVVGDLTGIPLLKFSADTGAKAVRTIKQKVIGDAPAKDGVIDVAIVGAGVSGMAAALECRKLGLSYELYEAAEPFSTIVNFPKAKPIYTYPTEMVPAGDLQFTAQIKEPLVDEIKAQTKDVVVTKARVDRIKRAGGGLLDVQFAEGPAKQARAVVVAIGRSGNYRKLGVPGEESGKVFNRLHDPKEFAGKDVLVVGGGDSALETAIAVAECGGRVTLSYRKPEFSRPKPDNVAKLAMLQLDPMADVGVESPVSERVTTAMGAFMGDYKKPGSIRLELGSQINAIRDDAVDITLASGQKETLPNQTVFTMIGREAPLDFFRKSGVPIRGEKSTKWWVTLILFVTFCIWLYHWKASDHGKEFLNVIPFPHWLQLDVSWLSPKNPLDRTTLLGTILHAASSRPFYYSLAYSVCVVAFGIDRIRRKPTPYIKLQTMTLMAVQVVPLFLLPNIILPWMGANGFFDSGAAKTFADQFFPVATWAKPVEGLGMEREYWRALGFVLAWPLFVWNWFTDKPMWGWLIVGFLQTFVLIPLMVRRWGKGAYCGWICSCGALAETLGDRHREKMPHGPLYNRMNMIGQVFLAFALVLLVLKILQWTTGLGLFGTLFNYIPIVNYYYLVDLVWAGIIGVALYFHFSGRVWCRFACPLAALMHIYHRFGKFAILADKKKCISCNVCTSVCHQGIDVMNFANKGLAMKDPECVRCSACVQSCPTGVLTFGRVDKDGKEIARDPAWLAASPVQIRETKAKLTVKGMAV